MLHKLKNRKEEGFTIIEVLIVLAIAGLIILIVLLAVPALQRNSRNTSIKNEASALVGGFSSFAANNDGAKAVEVTATGNICSVAACAATGVSEQVKLQGGTTVNKITAQPSVTTGAVLTHGELHVWLQHNCKGDANSRANAVWYSVEVYGTETAANSNRCADA